MAAGCAVVASDIPAFRAVLGAAGRLVPPGEVAALAGAIALLLGDPATATALGEAAAASVRRFDWPKVTESYRRAYESALERHGSRIGRPKE
jgi:phosphatidylinositol alpha-mannosyltransferase